MTIDVTQFDIPQDPTTEVYQQIKFLCLEFRGGDDVFDHANFWAALEKFFSGTISKNPVQKYFNNRFLNSMPGKLSKETLDLFLSTSQDLYFNNHWNFMLPGGHEENEKELQRYIQAGREDWDNYDTRDGLVKKEPTK